MRVINLEFLVQHENSTHFMSITLTAKQTVDWWAFGASTQGQILMQWRAPLSGICEAVLPSVNPE